MTHLLNVRTALVTAALWWFLEVALLIWQISLDQLGSPINSHLFRTDALKKYTSDMQPWQPICECDCLCICASMYVWLYAYVWVAVCVCWSVRGQWWWGCLFTTKEQGAGGIWPAPRKLVCVQNQLIVHRIAVQFVTCSLWTKNWF